MVVLACFINLYLYVHGNDTSIIIRIFYRATGCIVPLLFVIRID